MVPITGDSERTTRLSTSIGVADSGREAGRGAASTALDRLGSDSVDFCQVFSSHTYDPGAVHRGVREVVGPGTPLLGCTSGGEFSDERIVDGGVAVALLASDRLSVFTGIGTGLSDHVDRAVREAVSGLPDGVEGRPHRSAIVLHDGLTDVGEQLAFALQRKLGPEVPIAGGAASDDHRYDRTVVLCDDRVLEDAVGVALVASEQRPILTHSHGHEPISGPLEVTDVEANVVRELDGRPAIETWTDAIRGYAESILDGNGFEDDPVALTRLSGEFEFGIDQGEAYKIRSSRMDIDEGTIHFGVDVPERTVFRVMHGRPERQVESARNAAKAAVSQAGDREFAGAFVYDCSCRKVVLGDDFAVAVDGIADELDVPFVGFETYGELSMQRGEMSGFHNTTTVIMAIPE